MKPNKLDQALIDLVNMPLLVMLLGVAFYIDRRYFDNTTAGAFVMIIPGGILLGLVTSLIVYKKSSRIGSMLRKSNFVQTFASYSSRERRFYNITYFIGLFGLVATLFVLSILQLLPSYSAETYLVAWPTVYTFAHLGHIHLHNQRVRRQTD